MDWNYQEIKLQGILSEFIDCVWWEYYHAENVGRANHYLVPDRSIELIFTCGTIERYNAEHKYPIKNKSQLCGIRTKPQVCVLDESPAISVRFYPQNFYRLCQVNMKETIDQSLVPSVVFGSSIVQLERDILKAKTQNARIQLIEKYFNAYLESSSKESDPTFEAMVSRIEQSNGTIPISDLSEEFNLSLKTIERKFSNCLGITAKKYSRLVRFTNHYMNNERSKGSEGKLDFYDQAHFIKEVKNFTGLAPETFNTKEIGIQRISFRKTSY